MTSSQPNYHPQLNSLADTQRQMAGIISSSLDLQEVLQQVLEQVHTVIPYDMANIMLLDGDITRVQISRGYQDPQAVERIHFDTQPLLAAPVKAQRALMVPPGMYFLDKQGKLLTLLQGEVTADQINKALK